VGNPKAPAALKAAILKEWDAHLYAAHGRQWGFEQKKKANFEAAHHVKGVVK
jgi:hypothetical protein